MAGLIYGLPTQMVSANATWTVTVGAADSAFPIANISDGILAKPFKGTSATITVRATFAGAQTIGLIGIGPHNQAGLSCSITNGAGMATQTITFEANHEDGQSVNGYKDISAVALNSSTTWNFAFSGGSSNVAIGEILLYSAKNAITRNYIWGYSVGDGHPVIEHETESGVPLIYDRGYKRRQFAGVFQTTAAGLSELLTMHRSCKGRVSPLLIVPDSADTIIDDALFVRFADTEISIERKFTNSNDAHIVWIEDSRGSAL